MPKVVDSFRMGTRTYQLREVVCGRDNCTKCPHGPYWYVVVAVGVGNSVQRYIGKNLPGDLYKTYLDQGGKY